MFQELTTVCVCMWSMHLHVSRSFRGVNLSHAVQCCSLVICVCVCVCACVCVCVCVVLAPKRGASLVVFCATEQRIFLFFGVISADEQ